MRMRDSDYGPTDETPEDMAVDCLVAAMPFLKLLEDCASFDTTSETYRVNGRQIDKATLSRLLGRIETGLSGFYPV